MRVIETEVFEFHELTPEVQEKVIYENAHINVEYFDWWDFIEYDAEQMGVSIKAWDIDRGFISIFLTDSPKEVALSFIKEYNKDSHIVADAERFLKYDNYRSFMEDIETWFLNCLQDQYNYLTSEEAIKETIEANGYEFTKDGELV